MTLRVHIERLVLDGVGAPPQLLQAALQVELARLLAQGGLAPELARGAAVARIAAPAPALATEAGGAQVGVQIAAAVYGGIGR
ncbi:MAG: hypothetical protein ACJ8LG_03035 [Massilia sp.]